MSCSWLADVSKAEIAVRRGQLGHGTLASEPAPRLVMALDGMKVKKVGATGNLMN
jgi:hypothetical protein